METDEEREFGRHFNAAIGYCELQMWNDAWMELEEIAPELRHCEEVIRMRLHIFIGLKKWDSAAIIGESLIAKGCTDGTVYLGTSYAVRRSRSLAEANAVLLSGERYLKDDAIFHFNTACYACQLGDLETAKTRLKRACELDAKYRVQALEDEDLQPLWNSLAA